MSIFKLDMIKSMVIGEKLSPEKEKALFAELLFMVLTRASRADLNVESSEVDMIVKVLKDNLDQDFTEKDIRVAAITELYEHAPFEKYVYRLGRKLSVEYRVRILDAVAEVFASDGTIGVLEADFFNLVANSLDLTPAQIRKL